MNLRELVTAFRGQIDDLPGDVPVDSGGPTWENDDSGLLWTNAEATRYANDAASEYCRRNPIVDSDTASICQIAVTAGTASYSLHNKILQVRRARVTGEAKDLEKRTGDWMDARYGDWRATTGTPLRCLEDQDHHKLLLQPIPTANGTVDLTVGRLPLNDMDWIRRQKQTPEVLLQHHSFLLHYMMHLAYLKRDSETYDKKASDRYLALFALTVGPPDSAEGERRSREERNLERRATAKFF